MGTVLILDDSKPPAELRKTSRRMLPVKEAEVVIGIARNMDSLADTEAGIGLSGRRRWGDEAPKRLAGCWHAEAHENIQARSIQKNAQP